MPGSLRRALGVVAICAAALIGVQVAHTPKAQAAPCPMPALAQRLAASAVKVEPIERDGRTGARFYLASSPDTTLDVQSLALNSDDGPPYLDGWHVYGSAWIEWLQSSPCTGDDGYAFAFNTRCYHNSTIVLCNFEGSAGLQYDHGTGDWDGVWGYRYYHPLNVTSCSDSGGYHFFPDNAPGRLRTWIGFHMRFKANNHLTAIRAMTSRILGIANFTTTAGSDWIPVSGFPSGGLNSC